MFERFSPDARRAVTLAGQEARGLRHGYIGCEHLLLGLSTGEGTPAAGALAAVGLQTAALRERIIAFVAGPLDADALACLGIDLDAVRRVTEDSFGPGALDQGEIWRHRHDKGRRTPFTPRAKKSMELAVQTAAKSGQNQITTGHLLLGVIDQRDNGALRVLKAAGVEPGALREELARRMFAAA
jgi:ATP-dependent Clp protease ATP-binding subunit ClpA